MSAKRDPLVYLDDILKSITLILQYTHSKTETELESSQSLKDAVLMRFEIIGEAALQLPEEFKQDHPQVDWRSMADMRNKIIHEYFGWNWYIIWKTIKEDLPPLQKEIEEILSGK